MNSKKVVNLVSISTIDPIRGSQFHLTIPKISVDIL